MPSWARDKNPDPYTSTRKVYAYGVRVGEMGLPETEVAEGVKIKIPAQPKSRQRCKTYMALPFGKARGWAPLSADANDVPTQEYGLRKRLLRPVPPVAADVLQRLAAFVDDWCERHLTPIQNVPTFEEWIGDTPYSEKRREQLRKWYYKYNGDVPPRWLCRKIDSFIKREAYLERKAARWINSRHDAFKAWSGRFFHAIEEAVFKLPNFVKHMTMAERVAAIMQLDKAGHFFYENDYKAFESHMVPQIMRAVELRVYKFLLRHYPYEYAAIERTLAGENKLRTRAGVKASVRGRRMSGDMCTSVGNGLTNLLVVEFIVAEKVGDVNSGLHALVEGDDGLFASPVELAAEDFEKMGFTAEIHKIDHPWQGHFCGASLAPDGTVLKDPHKVLSTFGWTHSMIGCGEETAMGLLRAKALSLTHEAPQCPIVGKLARAALDFTQGYEPRWTDTWKQKMWEDLPLGVYCPSDAARDEFARKTGISAEVQVLVEDRIQSRDLNSLHTLIRPPRDVEWYSSVYVEVSG